MVVSTPSICEGLKVNTTRPYELQRERERECSRGEREREKVSVCVCKCVPVPDWVPKPRGSSNWS